MTIYWNAFTTVHFMIVYRFKTIKLSKKPFYDYKSVNNHKIKLIYYVLYFRSLENAHYMIKTVVFIYLKYMNHTHFYIKIKLIL